MAERRPFWSAVATASKATAMPAMKQLVARSNMMKISCG
jgi:hypothetical protein